MELLLWDCDPSQCHNGHTDASKAAQYAGTFMHYSNSAASGVIFAVSVFLLMPEVTGAHSHTGPWNDPKVLNMSFNWLNVTICYLNDKKTFQTFWFLFLRNGFELAVTVEIPLRWTGPFMKCWDVNYSWTTAVAWAWVNFPLWRTFHCAVLPHDDGRQKRGMWVSGQWN